LTKNFCVLTKIFGVRTVLSCNTPLKLELEFS
jgi:hypothetical protein